MYFSEGRYEEKLNSLLNSGLLLWQAGGAAATTTVSNGASTYFADQFYIRNSLGTSAIIAGERITSNLPDGVKAAAQFKVTTAPTASHANGIECLQPLDNIASLPYYNARASMAIYVKAVGNVTQAAIQFAYSTSESKLTTLIGSQVTRTVSTSGWTRIPIHGQAMGTSQTTAGIVGFLLKPTAVSSGNIYDVGNGLQFTKAIMVVGPVAPKLWRPHSLWGEGEVAACQRFFETSYALNTAPGTVTSVGAVRYVRSGANSTGPVCFRTRKRTTPSITSYSPTTGTSGKIRDVTDGVDRDASPNEIGETSYNETRGLGSDGGYAFLHFTADARI